MVPAESESHQDNLPVGIERVKVLSVIHSAVWLLPSHWSPAVRMRISALARSHQTLGPMNATAIINELTDRDFNN